MLSRNSFKNGDHKIKNFRPTVSEGKGKGRKSRGKSGQELEAKKIFQQNKI